MRRSRSRQGYVLLMTVVLIAVAGLLLAGIARQSLSLAVEAGESQGDLQRRWGEISCRQAILLRADTILKQQRQLTQKGNAADAVIGTANVSARVVLGGMTFDLLLADETAKVSLNAIYRSQDDAAVGRIVSETSQAVGALPLRLRPYRSSANAPNAPAFDSWGQVFALDSVESNMPAAEWLEASTTELTCWGDGKLNLERATDENVKRISRLVVSDDVIGRLLELRRQCLERREAAQREMKTATTEATARAAAATATKPWLPELLVALKLPPSEQRHCDELFVDHSTSYSLWITIRTAARSWQRLSIVDTSVGSQPHFCSFSW
jgi:hypothetical protein